MPIPITNRKENMGQAYVHAIAAKVGYNMARSEGDYGLDGTIKYVEENNGRYHETGFTIEYQLKSSSDVSFENGKVIYDLESKNYNDLAGWNGAMPSILILFVMPSREDEWINCSESRLEIRKCAWWYSLQGMDLTENRTKKRIYIPQEQVFSPESLEKMMNKVRDGEPL